MNHLDTFSGIGGWALASRWMGWNTVAFVEKDKFCHKVLNKNFPDIPIHDDIFTFPGKPFRGRVDILTGSTPCQPFSQAGKRQGSNDERHLFPEFLRVVAEVRPRWIVIENVFGLLNIESGRVFEAYNTSLESEGYSAQTLCIPASALNAPHRRDRLWIIAYSNSDESGLQGQSERCGERIWGRHQRHDNTTGNTESENGRPEKRFRANEFIADSDIKFFSAEQDIKQTAGLTASRWNDIGGCDVSTNTLNSEHRTVQRPQREADSVSGNSERLQGSNERTDSTGQSETSFGLRNRNAWRESWLDVAARTCIRGMDDGLPDELHIVGSRDNRVNRLKALGNAIVPQIAYEIFRAIQDAEYERQRS